MSCLFKYRLLGLPPKFLTQVFGGSWGFAILLSPQELLLLLLLAQGPHFEYYWHRQSPRLPSPRLVKLNKETTNWILWQGSQFLWLKFCISFSCSTWSFLPFVVSINWWASVPKESFEWKQDVCWLGWLGSGMEIAQALSKAGLKSPFFDPGFIVTLGRSPDLSALQP